MATDTTNIASAQTVNAAIVDTNNIEYYKKTVNSIYINTYANNLSPGTMDSGVLDNISA
ncbi:MAG: hypothetical protein IPP29_03130 [Bacteroidetes bacterium]|nr:hypothetical protein [Bacteroidota bacterium]